MAGYKEKISGKNPEEWTKHGEFGSKEGAEPKRSSRRISFRGRSKVTLQREINDILTREHFHRAVFWGGEKNKSKRQKKKGTTRDQSSTTQQRHVKIEGG